MKLHAQKEIVRKYYKYVVEPFIQPILASNGIMGGGSFACASDASDAYKAFDNNDSTYVPTGNNTGYVSFYNPLHLNATQLEVKTDSGATGEIQASNDNSTWVSLTNYNLVGKTVNTIPISTSTPYKYYKIQHSHTTDARCYVYYVNITASQLDIRESTVDDYDFYEDVEVWQIPFINNKYYASTQGV